MEAEVKNSSSLIDKASCRQDADDRTQDGLMKKGLFAASRQPAKLNAIRSFQVLHSPRIHGMAEWILQYETVCRRQDLYLQQIKELRQQFRTRTDDSPAQSRDSSPFSTKSSKSSGSSAHWTPSRMPLIKLSNDSLAKKACILQPRRKHKVGRFYGDYWQSRYTYPKTEAPDFLMAPKTMISNKYTQKHAKESTSLPPIGELDRNKTDYEPIEHIAKRNKLNLSKYLREGQNWTRVAGKDTVDMSDVIVQSTKIV